MAFLQISARKTVERTALSRRLLHAPLALAILQYCPVVPVEIMRHRPYAGVRMLRDFVKHARRLEIRVRHFPRCLLGRIYTCQLPAISIALRILMSGLADQRVEPHPLLGWVT